MTLGPLPYPPQPPPAMPGPMYGASPRNDSKAVWSLVLGLLSILCCTGIFSAIPAVVLGVMSRRDIARSGGALGGGGLAIAGIACGAFTSLATVGYIAYAVASVGHGLRPIPTAPPFVYSVPTAPTTAPLATSAISSVELSPAGGDLDTQLLAQIGEGMAAGEKILLYVHATGATACEEFEAALPDPQIQRALARVRLIRVEASQFTTELRGHGMLRPTYPWFWRVGRTPKGDGTHSLQVGDGLSADAWDANEAHNIAPVLRRFVAGHPLPHGAPSSQPKPHPKAPSFGASDL